MVLAPEQPARTSTPLWQRLRVGPVVVAIVAVVLPVVVTLVAVSGRPWFATGDYAHTELLVRAIPDHPPLVGVAARVASADGQGSTPGPSMAYLLYPAYTVLGSSGLSLLWSNGLLHVAGIVAAVLLARRNGGIAAALLLAGTLALMTRALVPDFFVQPWNVWLPLYAFVVFVMLVWGLARGDVVLLPWAVLVGSHCVQTHVSYTVLVTGLLGAVLVWLFVLALRTELVALGRLLVFVAVGAVLFVLAWLPPLVEQLRPGTGNMTKLVEEFGSPSQPYVGLRAALKAIAGELNLLGPWIVGPGKEPADAPNLLGFVAYVALVAGGVRAAWRRRDREVLTLQAVLGVLLVLAVFSVSRVFGTFFEYTIRWLWPVAALTTMASLWSLWRAYAAEQRTAAGAVPGSTASIGSTARAGVTGIVRAGFAGLAVVTALAVASAAQADTTFPRDGRITEELTKQLATKLSPTARYRLEHHDPAALGSAAFGIVLGMEREGFHVGIDEAGRAGALPFRVVPRDQADAVLLLVVGDESIDAVRARGDAVELAYADVRSADDRARSAVLREELERTLCADGMAELIPRLDDQYGHASLLFDAGLPDETARLLRAYNELRLPAAVFELPPDSPPFQRSARSGEETCRLLEES